MMFPTATQGAANRQSGIIPVPCCCYSLAGQLLIRAAAPACAPPETPRTQVADVNPRSAWLRGPPSCALAAGLIFGCPRQCTWRSHPHPATTWGTHRSRRALWHFLSPSREYVRQDGRADGGRTGWSSDQSRPSCNNDLCRWTPGPFSHSRFPSLEGNPWRGIQGKKKHLAFRRPDAKTAAISTGAGTWAIFFNGLGLMRGGEGEARATIGKQGPATTPKTPSMVGALFRRFGSFRKRISNTGSTASNTTWRDDHDSR